MSLRPTTSRLSRQYYVAQLGDVRGYGTTAKEAVEECERAALVALTWTAPVVEVTGTRILVAFQNCGGFSYSQHDKTGRTTCTTSTGDTFAEVVASMKRHADAWRSDEELSAL